MGFKIETKRGNHNIPEMVMSLLFGDNKVITAILNVKCHLGEPMYSVKTCESNYFNQRNNMLFLLSNDQGGFDA